MVEIKKGEEEIDQDKNKNNGVYSLCGRNQTVGLVSLKLLMSNVMH